MTLIEGIGDEVIHFFLLIAVVVIALGAWWSTNISERPLMRTVLILERRGTRHTTSDNQSSLGDIRDTSDLPPEASELETEEKTSDSDANNQVEMNVVENLDNKIVDKEIPSGDMNSEESPKPSCPPEETESVGDTNETDESAIVRNRRIAFFENMEDPSQNQNKCVKNSVDDSTTLSDYEAHSSDEGNITIRLKYLNDDLKLVEGKLQEQLGDFKRRHFSLELAGRKLVRLIFNGKVLQQDTKTLQNYGFFDNCVVHCLVHQPRTPPPSPNLNRPRSEPPNENVHHWDLGNILFASLSFLLGLAWYGRYQYAQLYTATTTVALIGLTGMFTVSLIGMYMPETDGLRTQ